MTTQHDLSNPPKWDVALEALAKEEAKKLARELTIDDFLQLSREHAIRFDDIMVTMFELVLNEHWGYMNANHETQKITRSDVNALYVNGRLNDKDVQEFNGYWAPQSS